MKSDFINTEYGRFSKKMECSKLEDICVPENGVQTGPFGSLLHKKDYVDSGTPIITVEHLDNNRISHIETPFVSDEDKERLSKYVMQEGDIVFSRVGSVDRRALVRKSEDGWLFSGRCLRVRVNQEIIDPVYLSHFFGMENFKAYVRSIAVGATMPSLNTKLLSDLPIYYPEYDIQLEIADILETLDQKIHLNQQTNETLEAMTQAIFKSWFVDFDPVRAKIEATSAGRDPNRAAMAAIAGVSLEQDWDEIEAALQQKLDLMTNDQRTRHRQTAELFPDELVESEIGEVPKGWGYDQLGNFITVKRGGSPRPIKNYVVEEGFNWTKIADATSENSPFILKTKEFIKEEGLKKTVLLDSGSLILSNSATPGLPKFLNIDACIHDGWLYFPEKRHFSDLYLYHLFIEIRKALVAKGSGTVFTNLKTSILREYDVVVANESLVIEFTKLAQSMFSTIKLKRMETENLSNLRDTLLPKLISGEITTNN